MHVQIDRAASQDLSDVLRIVCSNGLTVEGLDAHLATVLVARNRGAIVGTAALEVYDDGVLLRSVAVEPALRGRNIGRRLVEQCIEVASGLGVPTMYLLTMTAERYFLRFGFQNIARADVPAAIRRSVQFTSACPPSCVVMKKNLRHAAVMERRPFLDR